MTTVVCDESKIKNLLEQCSKCPKLKNVVKIGAPVTDEEKAAGEKAGVKIICFKELEVSQSTHTCTGRRREGGRSRRSVPPPLFGRKF